MDFLRPLIENIDPSRINRPDASIHAKTSCHTSSQVQNPFQNLCADVLGPNPDGALGPEEGNGGPGSGSGTAAPPRALGQACKVHTNSPHLESNRAACVRLHAL